MSYNIRRELKSAVIIVMILNRTWHGGCKTWEFRATLYSVNSQPFIYQTKRIFNGCEVLIENSVTRVSVRHHEATE